MNNILNRFKFDVKLLRIIYLVPFFVYGISIGLSIILGEHNDAKLFLYIFLQGIAIPVSGWHIAFIYSSLYEEGAEETLIFYYRKTLIHDLIRYTLLHGSILFLIFLFTFGFHFFSAMSILHLILLFLFFQLVSVALLSKIKTLDITLAIVSLYTFIEVITQGTFMPWPHLFFFTINESADFITFSALIVGIVLSIFQLWREFR